MYKSIKQHTGFSDLRLCCVVFVDIITCFNVWKCSVIGCASTLHFIHSDLHVIDVNVLCCVSELAKMTRMTVFFNSFGFLAILVVRGRRFHTVIPPTKNILLYADNLHWSGMMRTGDRRGRQDNVSESDFRPTCWVRCHNTDEEYTRWSLLRKNWCGLST